MQSVNFSAGRQNLTGMTVVSTAAFLWRDSFLISLACLLCAFPPPPPPPLFLISGRLQYLRFCLFEMYVNVVFVVFVQRSEWLENSALYEFY